MIFGKWLLLATITLPTAACGGQTTPPTSHAAAPMPAPPSCSRQYASWQHGSAHLAARRLAVTLKQIRRAGDARNLPAIRSAMGELTPIAVDLADHPIPHCADPASLYQRLVTRIYTAGASARRAAPSHLWQETAQLKDLATIQHQLTAEASRVTPSSPRP